MATAIASTYMNIPLIHTMGGERTGTLDESVRHSISKLAHLHFVANNESKKRLIKMGERSNRIFNVGCPRIDTVRKALKSYTRKNLLKTINKVGVGDKVKVNEDIIVLSQHPVTSEFEASTKNYEKTVNAILKLKNNNIKIVWLWPNSDAGSDEISGFIRKFREKKIKNKYKIYYKYFPR